MTWLWALLVILALLMLGQVWWFVRECQALHGAHVNRVSKMFETNRQARRAEASWQRRSR